MEFPDWVDGPTACATRTYSVTLDRSEYSQLSRNKYPSKIVQSVANVPVVLVRNTETGKLLTAWANFTNPHFQIVEE